MSDAEASTDGEICAVCDRTYFIESSYLPGLCQTCGFVAHCEGY